EASRAPEDLRIGRGQLAGLRQRRQKFDDIDEILSLKLLLQVGGHERESLLFESVNIFSFELVNDGLGGFDFHGVVRLADENAAQCRAIERADEPGFEIDTDAGAGVEN